MKEIKLPDYMYMASPLHVAQKLGQIPTEKELETKTKNNYIFVGAFIGVSVALSAYLIWDGYTANKKKTNCH